MPRPCGTHEQVARRFALEYPTVKAKVEPRPNPTARRRQQLA